MSKLVGTYKRCKFCCYATDREFNMKRHVALKHHNVNENKIFKMMTDGVYQCLLHDVPIKYEHRYQLRRHYYFVHRADDSDLLTMKGIDPQKIEELCRDCKGTSYEYSLTREDYHKYCTRHEGDGDEFERFLTLNRYYEEKFIEEQFIIGNDLFEEYKKEMEGEHDEDDDDY